MCLVLYDVTPFQHHLSPSWHHLSLFNIAFAWKASHGLVATHLGRDRVTSNWTDNNRHVCNWLRAWLSHDFLMTFSWISEEFLMTYSKISHDFLLTFSWLSWISFDFLVTFLWHSCDFLGTFLWLSHDFLMTFMNFS